jgi:hypothetical protein
MTERHERLTDSTNAYGLAQSIRRSRSTTWTPITNLVIRTDGRDRVRLGDGLAGHLPCRRPHAVGLHGERQQGLPTVTATANAVGGAVSGVTAVTADPTIVGVTVANGATNSTIR